MGHTGLNICLFLMTEEEEEEEEQNEESRILGVGYPTNVAWYLFPRAQASLIGCTPKKVIFVQIDICMYMSKVQNIFV